MLSAPGFIDSFIPSPYLSHQRSVNFAEVGTEEEEI